MKKNAFDLRNGLSIAALLALLGVLGSACCPPAKCPDGSPEPCQTESSSSGGSTSSSGGSACSAACDGASVQAAKVCIAGLDEPPGPARENMVAGCCRRIAEDPSACPAARDCVEECKGSP